jgi:glycosyltransferase involved in cell wall biosynthesis
VTGPHLDPEGKPTVAVWRNNFLPYSETFIHDQLRFHERYRAVVFCRTRRNAALFPHEPTVALEEIPRGGSKLASTGYGVLGVSPRFDRELDRYGAKIVHAHFGHNGAFALPFAQRHRLPLVVSLHGHDVTVLGSPERFQPAWLRYTWRKRALFDYAAAFLATSTELRELIIAAGCPPGKVRIHRLGIDLGHFAPRTRHAGADGAPLVVMVGRFVEKKGHEYGLRAFARARRGGLNARLVIAGDGPLRGRYERLIAELDLGGSVELPGTLPHEKVSALLAAAAVVLTPSVVARTGDREGGLTVAKETAACAIPVIGTYHGGIPEIIDDGVTGYLVAERDAEALGDRLCAILRDPALGSRLGAAARVKMAREYDIVQQVRDLEAIYDGVIAG